MTDDTVLPTADEPAAASAELTEQNRAIDEADPEAEKPEAKPEEDPKERALKRAERKIDRLVRQREELRARLHSGADLRSEPIGDTNQKPTDDSDTLSLSRAELAALVKQEAAKLAPTIKQQSDEMERNRAVAGSLVKEWGAEVFAERTNDLAEVFDANKQLLVLGSKAPAALIEYLTDEDNADEAEAIGRMPIGMAGYALAEIAHKIKQSKAADKPQPSKAATPLEAVRGQGAAPIGYTPQMTDAQFAAFRKRQIAQRR